MVPVQQSQRDLGPVGTVPACHGGGHRCRGSLHLPIGGEFHAQKLYLLVGGAVIGAQRPAGVPAPHSDGLDVQVAPGVVVNTHSQQVASLVVGPAGLALQN